MYNKGYADRIVLTGGIGEYAPAESVAAMNYGSEFSMDPNVFVLEESSTRQKKCWICKGSLANGESVFVVSDSYHILRSEKVFAILMM